MYNLIKQAITNINATADVYMFNPERHEAENLNYTRTSIRIHTDFRIAIKISNSNELINTTTYTVDFLDFDEWDNFDYKENQQVETSLEIINRMRILANSIFFNILNGQNLYFPNKELMNWTADPVWRKYNGTMSGVSCRINLAKTDNVVCSYGD